MKCDTAKRQLPFLDYGELSFGEEQQLHQHLNQCPQCREEYGILQSMHAALDLSEPEVHPSLHPQVLNDCRRNLRLTVAAAREAGTGQTYLWPLWFSRLLGAAALIAVGFFGGLYVQGIDIQNGPTPVEAATAQVRMVEPEGSGQVEIVVAETRQRVLSGHVTEEPIRRLLLGAVRDSADPGLRVEMMDLLIAGPQTRDVRETLLHALQNDPVADVRLKALEGLRSSAKDPEIRRVLAHVLLRDAHAGVRIQAVDLLTQEREPSVAGLLQELMTREDDNFIRLKSQKALRAMNASVESF